MPAFWRRAAAAQVAPAAADDEATMPRLHFLRLLLRACCALALPWLAASAMAAPLEVDGRASIAVWPAVTLMVDPGRALTVEQALARPFATPAGTPGNLGRLDAAVWLRIPLHVPGNASVQRVLELDYPSLNRIDLHLLHGGRVVALWHLGSELPLQQRPLPTRTHAAALTLEPGDSELLLRVQTRSSMVLPMTLRSSAAFTAQESGAALLQGAIAGLALCMLMYSVMHWISLRDRMFLDYAFMLGSNMVFLLAYFGIASQYLWPQAPPWAPMVVPLAVLVAVSAGSNFMRAALAMREVSRAVDSAMVAIGVLALAGVAAALLDLADYGAVQTLATVLGMLTTVLVLPVAYVRARRGERVAAYMLIGWAFYAVGAGAMAGLVRGQVEPTFWNLHLYPLATMIEMSAWMAVLGLRVQDIHRSADRARVESDTLRALAHTDPLTGLPNRRGLLQHLGPALRQCSPDRLLAVFLLDLDGFKPVNDRYGHDVGDALLLAVGQRLQAQLRGTDVVGRLGGDEFLVLASGLADEGAARTLGEKLLAAFATPFDVAGQRCTVGLTVGYALAPLDGSDADDLIKRADAAMYAGKQAGRHRVQRGGRSLVAA
jgi:diguanylate cyclase (GGDEF)-like protein